MNHNEIESCVIKAKHGNQESLLKIIEQFKPFVFKTAKSFTLNSYDIHDLAQIGYTALINAVIKYRTGSHTFSSYAYEAIKNALKYTARKSSKFSGDLSLNSPLNSSNANSEEFIDCMEDPENIEVDILRFEKIEEVRKAVTKLSVDEIELVVMVYYSEVPLSSYARIKDISYLNASRRKNRILKKLNCLLTN